MFPLDKHNVSELSLQVAEESSARRGAALVAEECPSKTHRPLNLTLRAWMPGLLGFFQSVLKSRSFICQWRFNTVADSSGLLATTCFLIHCESFL